MPGAPTGRRAGYADRTFIRASSRSRYVRACEPDRVRRDANFEVVVGTVHRFDYKPKPRLHEVLREQSLQTNQDITSLSGRAATGRGAVRVPVRSVPPDAPQPVEPLTGPHHRPRLSLGGDSGPVFAPNTPEPRAARARPASRRARGDRRGR